MTLLFLFMSTLGFRTFWAAFSAKTREQFEPDNDVLHMDLDEEPPPVLAHLPFFVICPI